jgi:NO-binding membrane sensor protein with MHYT domain
MTDYDVEESGRKRTALWGEWERMGQAPWLVPLSVVMAIQGSYVGLQLAAGLKLPAAPWRRMRLAASATAFAVGIWSMHFIGMLAAQLPPGIDFLVLPTLISFLICVIVVGFAVCALQMGGSLQLRLALGALAMGSGIFIMHYVGMVAVHGNALMSHELFHMILAFGIAVTTSGFALWLLNRPAHAMPIWLAACVLGIAVSGMHYTAMAGTSFAICDVPTGANPPAFSRDTLAIVVALIGFSVSGSFLLSLLPDSRVSATAAVAVTKVSGDAPAEGGMEDEAGGQPPAGKKDQGYENIIVEKDGKPRNILVGDIRSVRANAHYTFVSDGTQEYFCKLSISAVEAALGSRHFMRVHRSYIVALAYVAAVHRQGENGLVDIAGATMQCSIPVARGRISALRQRLGGDKPSVKPTPGAAFRASQT